MKAIGVGLVLSGLCLFNLGCSGDSTDGSSGDVDSQDIVEADGTDVEPQEVDTLDIVQPPACRSDEACDDGDPCTIDRCEASGTCAHEAFTCPSQPCASNACDGDGGCEWTVDADWCLVDESCIPALTGHPDEPCLACVPSVDPLDWSPKPSGHYCGGKGALPIKELMFITRTGLLPTNKTDDGINACLSDAHCFNMDNLEINDRELGQVDHFVLDPSGMTYDDIQHVAMKVHEDEGENGWVPICVAVIVDGDLMYCNDDLNFSMGSSSSDDELMEWVDDNPYRKTCGGCYLSTLTHGPMVGNTTGESAIFWFRTSAAFPVTIRASTQSDLTDPTVVGPKYTIMADDFTGTLTLSGLQPNTRYYYEVLVDGVVASKPELSFRTAPVGPSAFRVAFGSCAKHSQQPIFNAVFDADPNVLLMIGDNHYANSADPAELDFYYRATRDILPFGFTLARTPTWAVWDDHDYTGNNTDGLTDGKEKALAAFKRYWANGTYGSDDTPGIWSSFRWGDVEFFLLDDRYYRGIDGSMLGAVQLQWLLDGLSQSTATFKVLVSGSQWTPAGSSDSWASFDAERELILDTVMETGVSGVFLISGDVHYAEVRRLRDKSATSYEVWEFTSSPLANSNSSCKGNGPDTQLFCVDDVDNFGLLHFDTAASPPQVTYEIRDDFNAVLYSVTVDLDALSL